jgi:hypothetical protein
MKRKSPISVRQAVEQVFDELPDTFHAPFFCERVKARTHRPILMDGTILRRLREARAERIEYNYRCIDPEISLYKKVKV